MTIVYTVNVVIFAGVGGGGNFAKKLIRLFIGR